MSTYAPHMIISNSFLLNISFFHLILNRLLITTMFLLSYLVVSGQDNRTLAQQYATDGSVDKAEKLYEQLFKQYPGDITLYKEYLKVLVIQKKYREALDINTKLRKKQPEERSLQVDLFALNKQLYDNEAFNKFKAKYFDRIARNQQEVELHAALLQKEGLLNHSIELLLFSRQVLSNERIYAQRLAQSYAVLSLKLPMLTEYLTLLETYQLTKEDVQNAIQMELASDSDFVALEELLISRLQQRPEQIEINELLVWLYIQQKDFTKAFQYEKARDIRVEKKGVGLLELANLAINNNDYAATRLICRYIVSKYSTGNTYFYAKRLLIYASEKQVKETWPIDKNAVREVIEAYQSFAIQSTGFIQVDELNLNIARLTAFYLGQLDTAVTIIQRVIENPRNTPTLIAEAKLDLGDIYLLLGDQWEASLTYSQVEKAQKEQPLGYEAKYRNARLNYFKGEFSLAQSHLDILKLATTREISNNAIALSLLIKSNTELDSTEEAMQSFAHVELLEYTQSLEIALDSLKVFSSIYYDHSLADDFLYKQASIYRKTGRYYESISVLDQLLTRFPTSIYADDALFTKAQIYELDLVLLPEAQQTYEQLLMEYKGSTLINESRRRYRKLRGDKIN